MSLWDLFGKAAASVLSVGSPRPVRRSAVPVAAAATAAPSIRSQSVERYRIGKGVDRSIDRLVIAYGLARLK